MVFILQTRGRWTYGVTFEPAIDALDTKSDVVILGLSSINTNPINYLPAVWTLNCDLELTAQQSTIIYAEVVGPVGILTGLSITVNLKNIDDTSSQDISIILIEEVEGETFEGFQLCFSANNVYYEQEWGCILASLFHLLVVNIIFRLILRPM